ncbi:MAG TPA: family 10 glycosylhydrolase, partial [Phycisphaerae bacterium]
FAINAAHASGLEFHAYINTHTCWQSAAHTPPADPDHLYYQHCNAADPDARDWLIHDASGVPVQYGESDYVWIAPGVPAPNDYTRQQILYVVQNYDVDGVHFDRIRTPGQQYSHDPISVARLNGQGNPNGLGFDDWTRDQITRFVRDVYAEIQLVKPWVKVSSAPLGLYAQSAYPGYPSGFNYGYTFNHQDAVAWMAAGAMDFICPQIYWADGGALPNFSDILPFWVANSSGRHVIAGQITSVGVTELLHEIDVSRADGAQGNTVFSYSSFSFWGNYSSGPYAQATDIPALPWKDSPTDGVIVGHVHDVATGLPLTDVHIIRSASTYTALSSADGFYSMLKIPPGVYFITATMPCYSRRTVPGVSVTAGNVAELDLGMLIGDANVDGMVNTVDLVTIRNQLDQVGPSDADVNCDNVRNLADIIRCRNYQGLSDP